MLVQPPALSRARSGRLFENRANVATFDDFREMIEHDYSNYASALCLWHDDQSPSLLIYHDGFFICQGCGEQGGFNKLYLKLCQVRGHRPLKRQLSAAPGLDFPAWSDKTGMQTVWEQSVRTLEKYPGLRWYIEKRGLGEEAWETYSLGWYNEWIIIPVLDPQGQLQGLVARATPGIQKATGMRYMIPAGQPPMPYVPNWARLLSEPAVFTCFGVLDAISIDRLGFGVMTGTNGKDHLDPAWLDAYRKPIGVIFDKGEYQAAAHPRLMSGLDWRGRLLQLHYPDGLKDPNDYLVARRGEQLSAELRSFVSMTKKPSEVKPKTCGKLPPVSRRCDEGHTCILTPGHSTPHRTTCGIRWQNRGGK